MAGDAALTEDLISRLRAAIEQHQALAEAAGGGTWSAYRMVDTGYFVADQNGRAVTRLWVELDELAQGPQPVGVNPLDTSKHIAAQDPSTVLARCRADLRLLAWYEETQRYADRNEAAGHEHDYGEATAGVLREVVEHLAEGYGIT